MKHKAIIEIDGLNHTVEAETVDGETRITTPVSGRIGKITLLYDLPDIPGRVWWSESQNPDKWT